MKNNSNTNSDSSMNPREVEITLHKHNIAKVLKSKNKYFRKLEVRLHSREKQLE